MSDSQVNQTPVDGLSIGDWIECDLTFPVPHMRAAQLNTEEALVMGFELLGNQSGGWRRATIDWNAEKQKRKA